MTPAESVLVGLVRAPLCVRMWWLHTLAPTAAAAALAGAPAGSSYSLTGLVARALCLAATASCATLAVHVFIRLSFERNCRAMRGVPAGANGSNGVGVTAGVAAGDAALAGALGDDSGGAGAEDVTALGKNPSSPGVGLAALKAKDQ